MKANLHEKDFALLDLVFDIEWESLKKNNEIRKKLFLMIRDDLQLASNRKQIEHRNCKNCLQERHEKIFLILIIRI